MPTNIFTNRDGNTLIKEFEGVLSNNSQITHLDAVTGFLRASGYFTLRQFLNEIHHVRMLVGINADKHVVEALRRNELFPQTQQVLDEYHQQLCDDIKTSLYRKDVEDGIRQMAKDLGDGKLELRAHPSRSIHAKFYILYPKEFNEYTQGTLITGSSNLSDRGLGSSKDTQYEFNVKMSRYDDVSFAKDEFERLWEEAADFQITADDVRETIAKTYLDKDATPYEIYIKALMECFEGRPLDNDPTDALYIPKPYKSFEYQLDAVAEGYRKLMKYNGFYLADVVGLGKTVIATMITKKFLIENRYRTKILVVYPPAVEQNWKATFHDFGIDCYTRFVSNGSLKKVLDTDNHDYWPAEEYDLIVIDEAHKYRSHDTQTYKYLQEICKMPCLHSEDKRKKVMLLSATPMNNTPEDIRNQILLFQDARRSTIDGITNLTSSFSQLEVEFKKSRGDSTADKNEFKRLAEKLRANIIKPITVRRTRTDIEDIPRYRKDIGTFPKVEPPCKVAYELPDNVADLFEKAMLHISPKEKDTPGSLIYARYRAIEFLLPEAANGLYDNAKLVSDSLSGIKRTMLVKRLESSFHAFKLSLNTYCRANRNMIDMFENDKVYIAPDADVNKLIESGASEEEIEEKINALAEKNPKNKIFKANDFKEEFLVMLRKDQEILDAMNEEWKDVTDDADTKFQKFKDLLESELFDKERNKEGKLVVFSESVDTVNYLEGRIKEIGRKDILVVNSSNRQREFKTIRANFDANYDKKSDDRNILLTTDVLAEGVNLHRANIIVNYDTPWNSTRLMQRIGRVNRIGSQHPLIYNYVFYPSRQGDREINLNQIAFTKIQTFHTVYGEDNQIYSQEEVIDHDADRLFDETLSRQDKEKDLELPFFEELRTLYHDDRQTYDRIQAMSVRSRTGRQRRTVDGVDLHATTLVFLKTNQRRLFYNVGNKAEPMSTVDALSRLKASPEEKAVPRIERHYDHVAQAKARFEQDKQKELNDQETKRPRTAQGAQVASALSLLNSMLDITGDDRQRTLMKQLRALVERGIISAIDKQLQGIQKRLRKGQMHRDEAFSEVLDLARHYAPYCSVDNKLREQYEDDPDVLLAESFN